MHRPLVSVILPIFNVSKYLERCLESVCEQTYSNLEIILVDDGSTDGSSLICDRIATNDSRITVIHKKNEGLGFARNTGLYVSNGEYIFFVDSDDYVDVTMIEKCVCSAEESKSDIVLFGFSKVDSSGQIVYQRAPFSIKKQYAGSEIEEFVLPSLLSSCERNRIVRNLWMSAWCFMYKHSLIARIGWSFVSERKIISEDVFSLLSLYKEVSVVSLISEPLYFYCSNDTSLTRTYNSDRYHRIVEFYNQTLELASSLGYSDRIKRCIAYPFIANTIGAIKLVLKSDLDKRSKNLVISNILNENTFKNAVKQSSIIDLSFKKKISFILLKLSFNHLWLKLISRRPL